MRYVHPAPQLHELVTRLDRDAVLDAIAEQPGPESMGIGEWVHWDKLRHLEPPRG